MSVLRNHSTVAQCFRTTIYKTTYLYTSLFMEYDYVQSSNIHIKFIIHSGIYHYVLEAETKNENSVTDA